MRPRTTAVVPTIGCSPLLGRCLEALGRAGGGEVEIVLVAQGEAGRRAAAEHRERVDHLLDFDHNLGFAAANNRGLAVARGDFVATVNDDAVVGEGWYHSLAAALEGDTSVAAVQGVNVLLDRPWLADGVGLEWNRWWQAVQIGHGEPAPAVSAPVREVFGVSATAALYRRASLPDPPFDERLFAYYEDVDLACRLRAAGHRALSVPAARTGHAGSTSGRRLALGGWPWIYGNRHLVLARHLGRAFPRRLPRILARDVLDLARALARAEVGRAAGILVGWGRAVRLLAGLRRRGEGAAKPPF